MENSNPINDDALYLKIKESIVTALADKFPYFDDVCPDTLAEIIDRLVILHIRYWYLKEAMSNPNLSDSELNDLRKKSELILNEKRPMLVRTFDKILFKLMANKLNYEPINYKFYKNWENK